MSRPSCFATWETHFPVGALLAMGAATTLPDAGPTQCNNVAGLTTHLTHPNHGLLANGLPYVLIYLGSPYFHAVMQDLPSVLEANGAFAFFQVMGRRTASSALGLTQEFTTNSGVANTRAVADPLIATVVADLGDQPSVLGYLLDDDASLISAPDKARRNHTLTRSFQAQDPQGRPASAMWRDTGYRELGCDARLVFTYEYACGHYANGTPTAEGDFHRATLDTITGLPGADWVDAIRHRVALLPPGARHLWCLQAHYTNTGVQSTRLRQPTDRELRKQFWTLIGEGATGLFWFTFTDFDPGGGVGPKPMLGARASALAVAKELSDRLTPQLRSRLLGCAAQGYATMFAASGGGTSGLPVDYPAAYVGELLHHDGARYVVVVNHATAPAGVVLSHPTLTGWLVSEETGARYRLGADAVPLGALDGTILRYDPRG